MFDLLRSLKVVDLTTIVLGPYATQTLADFGAEVIKVEPPGGDILRAVRPGRRKDLGVQFQNFNRNKRSLTIDLKQVRGREVLHSLVEKSDVVVHNMRSRSAASLGASYAELSACNPKLVYCYSAGYGDSGPDRDAPAYDDIIQARSGLATLNADATGAPQFVRTIVGDKVVGLHLAIAVLAGVVHFQRTGQGTCIEIPMLESMTAFLLAEHLAGHSLIPPEGDLGYSRLTSPSRRPYPTKDGFVAILPYSTRHWTRFFTASGRADLANDPRVLDPEKRSENIDDLYSEVAKLALGRTTSEWLELMAEQDIPCARVNGLADLFTDSHLEAVQLFERVSDPELGEIQQVRSPYQVDGATYGAGSANTVAPCLGEHTDQVLEELGYSEQEISDLHAESVVTSAAKRDS